MLGAALAACAPQEAAETTETEAVLAEGAEDAECAAEDFAYLVGRSRAEAVAAELPEPHRIYGTRDMVTQDYVPQRLNVVVGEDEIVTAVTCG
jgi:hypothetical protein